MKGGGGRNATHPAGRSSHWGWRIATLPLCLSYICSVIPLIAIFSFFSPSPSLLFSPHPPLLFPFSICFIPASSLPLQPLSSFTDESIRWPRLFLCSSVLHVSIISERAASQRLLKRPVRCSETTQLSEVKSDE